MNCTPQTLVNNPKWFVIDIRTKEERYDDFGFIPGSLWIPLDSDSFQEQVFHLALEHTVVLVCLSGHRSEEACQHLRSMIPQDLVYSLEGGLLAWRSFQLPISGLNYQFNPPPNMDIFSQIRACFVAQMTETMLDNEEHELFENPMNLLNSCFQKQNTTPKDASVQQWHHVLDHLAHLSKSKGTQLKVVQEHLDEFINILPKS